MDFRNGVGLRRTSRLLHWLSILLKLLILLVLLVVRCTLHDDGWGRTLRRHGCKKRDEEASRRAPKYRNTANVNVNVNADGQNSR